MNSLVLTFLIYKMGKLNMTGLPKPAQHQNDLRSLLYARFLGPAEGGFSGVGQRLCILERFLVDFHEAQL